MGRARPPARAPQLEDWGMKRLGVSQQVVPVEADSADGLASGRVPIVSVDPLEQRGKCAGASVCRLGHKPTRATRFG